jgi:hypothetical protein
MLQRVEAEIREVRSLGVIEDAENATHRGRSLAGRRFAAPLHGRVAAVSQPLRRWLGGGDDHLQQREPTAAHSAVRQRWKRTPSTMFSVTVSSTAFTKVCTRNTPSGPVMRIGKKKISESRANSSLPSTR